MPDLLQETGQNIESAGQSAVKTSLFLKGGEGVETDASDLSRKAATALTRAYREIQEVAEMMARVGEEMDDIRIPTFEPEYREVLGMKVISSLDMGSRNPLDKIATRMKSSSTKLDKLGEELRDVSGSLRKLSGVLTDVGEDIQSMGVQLTNSGQTLVRVSDFQSLNDLVVGKEEADERDWDDFKSGFSVTDV